MTTPPISTAYLHDFTVPKVARVAQRIYELILIHILTQTKEKHTTLQLVRVRRPSMLILKAPNRRQLKLCLFRVLALILRDDAPSGGLQRDCTVDDG